MNTQDPQLATAAEDDLLPVGIAENLSGAASSLAASTTKLLALYQSWGYELLSPPIVERATIWQKRGDLRRETIQFPDQLSGEQLSLRSDITPQIMRVVAQRLKPKLPARFCYHGEVLRARTHGAHDTRNAMQVGAEYVGSGGELESIWLLWQSLLELGFSSESLVLSLGQALIWRRLLQVAEADSQQQQSFYLALTSKDFAHCARIAHEISRDARLRRALSELPHCYGDTSVLSQVDQLCIGIDADIDKALAELRCSAEALQNHAQIHIDISDVLGYSYHNGIVFSAHSSQVPHPLGRGGAYSITSSDYHSAASGFSIEINKLMRWQKQRSASAWYLAPELSVYLAEPTLRDYIQTLRSRGERVLHTNGGGCTMTFDDCCGQIAHDGVSWCIKPLN